ncbi:hypothetical protein IM511_12070 [Erythrobacteraceae bacterium E2-1 Yellow Sea]|nr:hypothetical protein [Erythrobacteraceae bacterium E2-1 Yellow Sea]
MAVRFALLAGAVLVSAPLAAEAGHDRVVSPEPASYRGLACETDETRVFAGDVEDDFGQSIAVCVRDEALTIRYSGEGDPQAVSCRIDACAGIIEFDHYVRYRFTIITLAWRDENGEFKLTESFDAHNEGEEPVHIITHTWSPEPVEFADAEPLEYPVVAYTEPLSMVTLSYRNWP